MKMDIEATSADANQIQVVGVAEGNWTIYLGKTHACNVQKFIIIKDLMNPINIGVRLLQELGAVLDFKQDKLHIGAASIPLLEQQEYPSFADTPTLNIVESDKPNHINEVAESAHENPQQIRVYNKHTVTIPQYSVAVLSLNWILEGKV